MVGLRPSTDAGSGTALVLRGVYDEQCLFVFPETAWLEMAFIRLSNAPKLCPLGESAGSGYSKRHFSAMHFEIAC